MDAGDDPTSLSILERISPVRLTREDVLGESVVGALPVGVEEESSARSWGSDVAVALV
jgi:hypothetical protein